MFVEFDDVKSCIFDKFVTFKVYFVNVIDFSFNFLIFLIKIILSVAIYIFYPISLIFSCDKNEIKDPRFNHNQHNTSLFGGFKIDNIDKFSDKKLK